jgi:hypothetical protein
MKVGTKSLLFGVHQFILHPLFVYLAWRKLYGPLRREKHPWRMLVAIVIHDWGYWGCRSMDGVDGDRHPEWAGDLAWHWGWNDESHELFCHSRFWARKNAYDPSRLSYADKLATAIMPPRLWAALATMSGEVHEYMEGKDREIHSGNNGGSATAFILRYRSICKRLLSEERAPESCRTWVRDKWNLKMVKVEGALKA